MKHALLLSLLAATLAAADATGRWTGTLTAIRPDGSERTQPALLVLKQDGANLTGTAGPDDSEQHPIRNGRAEDGKLTFEVPTGETVMKFALKHAGDEINGAIERDRDGETQKARLIVKRAP